jgi:aspartyl-tRNA(Asn)/glutamyl-tRNA(Gln) amidotransferase subunit B
MQEGSFRCDANVSVRPMGSDKLGTRCEIKNLNSFRFLEKAIEHEVRRQVALIEDGGTVRQETRLWDPQKGETRSMRSKEEANDYRYFPDPAAAPRSRQAIARKRDAMPGCPSPGMSASSRRTACRPGHPSRPQRRWRTITSRW